MGEVVPYNIYTMIPGTDGFETKTFAADCCHDNVFAAPQRDPFPKGIPSGRDGGGYAERKFFCLGFEETEGKKLGERIAGTFRGKLQRGQVLNFYFC
jgi:hypothetical protein